MSTHNHGNEGVAREVIHPSDGPYWRQAHRHWWFWIGLFLMLLAITIYVVSNNLAFLPRFRQPQSLPSAAGK
jgi:hypothetical protein